MSGRYSSESVWELGNRFQVIGNSSSSLNNLSPITYNLSPITYNLSPKTYDLVVIGGGIIGSSSAIEIAERHPDWSIALIEKVEGPLGASTRNAGFSCFGSVSEIAADIDLIGPDATRELVQQRVNGLRILRDRCGDANIDYEPLGSCEIFFSHHPLLDRLNEVNDLLMPVFGAPAFEHRDDLISSYRLQASSLVHTPFDGQLHSGKLVQRLWQLAQERGVEFIRGEVKNIERLDSGQWSIVNGQESIVNGQESIVADRVVVATNARIPELASGFESPQVATGRLQSPSVATGRLGLRPARGQILVTEPIPDLALHGSFHFDSGYVYFRNVGNRVLLGGGRNIAFEEEETLSMETTPRIQEYLEDFLYNVILPHQRPAIEYRWAGTMAFNTTKRPDVQEVAPGLYTAFGCNGMGVAIGSTVAQRVSLLTG